MSEEMHPDQPQGERPDGSQSSAAPLSGEALAQAFEALVAGGSATEEARLLAASATEEELDEIDALASSGKEWHHRMAAELALTPHGGARVRVVHWPVWAGAGMAAALTLAAGLTFWWQQVHTPERLLAEAYTRERIFPLRMPGAGFSEVKPETHLRGSGTGREASKLLDALARIERQLEHAPDNPHWQQLEARADLLEEKFDPAIDILDRLLAAGPVTAELLTDDAAAYFERGTATGSENDRATALNYLSRADELAPGDPVVLFNEAVVMEDRGQMMNAVETWDRYLRFERDPRWLAEGRQRLELLKQKLNQLKTHQGRMEQDLGTPQAMRTLATDPAALAAVDEELSSALLPRLLLAAYPLPDSAQTAASQTPVSRTPVSQTTVRSRGSPCAENCLAARQLLNALGASLERNHQDPWLTQLLPSDSLPPSSEFTVAAHTLGQAIAADVAGDYAQGQQQALKAARLFHLLRNAAGEDRAVVEQTYALQVLSDYPGCYRAAHPLLGRNPQFAWIQIQAVTEDSACDPASGTSEEDNPAFLRAVSQAAARHYTILELRARNWLGAAAVDTGDVENSWRIYLGTVERFWSGDYPAMRLYSALSGLEEIEESTPRTRHALLLQREAVAALEASQNSGLIPAERLHLAAAAIRAGAVEEAQGQMRRAQQELAAGDGAKSIGGFLVEDENAMAAFYLDRKALTDAAAMLEAAHGQMAGEKNTYHSRAYALNRGRLELALGHLETAERLLRAALIEEERLAGKGGAASITLAEQDRDLYAVLAGVWLVQGRPGEEVLALWERYRLRILGKQIAPCAGKGLDCLKPQLAGAVARLAQDRVLGQVVLFDRVLLYQATASGVEWSTAPVGRDELLAVEAPLERAASSPATTQTTVDWAAKQVGSLLMGSLSEPPQAGGQLLIESDPLLGNLPWPAVEDAAGPIGLRFDLEEMPSLLLAARAEAPSTSASGPLVVGASVGAGQESALPEVLDEARTVARLEQSRNLLLGAAATQAQVSARLASAPAIHFAGHATVRDGATRLLLAPDAGGKAYFDSDLLRKTPPRAARLAVFSACSTGKREEGWNHGMGDIVNTLAALGVPQVVATRWQIDSASAVPMMDAFYGGLAQGLSVPRALTAARQSLVKDARYRHPYYWAAYYASGSGSLGVSQVTQHAQ